MLEHLRPAIALTLLLAALTGIAYPFAITGAAQLIAPAAANGSIVERAGKLVGSELIGQAFASDKYFWPRPSAAGANGYDGASSSGSNLGPTSAKLMERIKAETSRYPGNGQVPADAVTASGSGLDPDISPANARRQAARIASARGMDLARVEALIEAHTQGRALGFIGEPRVNVLKINLALDAATPAP